MMGKGRWIIGLIVIACGTVLMLNTLNITNVQLGSIMSEYFWPAVFILIGVSFWTSGKHLSTGRLIIGLMFVGLSALVIAGHLGWVHMVITNVWTLFWPIVIIIVGINLLGGSRRSRNWAILGGVDRRRHRWSLKDGDYWAVMGGVNLDLRNADIRDGDTVIHTTAFMGGIEVIVPDNLTVTCEGTAILGGLHFFGRDFGGIFTSQEAEQRNVEGSSKHVRIYCQTVMGGIRVISRPDMNQM
jgi:predicted membrane protein